MNILALGLIAVILLVCYFIVRLDTQKSTIKGGKLQIDEKQPIDKIEEKTIDLLRNFNKNRNILRSGNGDNSVKFWGDNLQSLFVLDDEKIYAEIVEFNDTVELINNSARFLAG